MADRIASDQVFTGTINMAGATTVNHKASSVTDGAIAAGAGIAASKLDHQVVVGTNFGVDSDATPTAQTKVVYVARGNETITGFRCLLNDTGTSTDVDFDLLINGTTALSAVVNITNSDADRAVSTGTLSTTALTAGDVLTMDLAVTSSTGAQGPWAQVEIDAPYT